MRIMAKLPILLIWIPFLASSFRLLFCESRNVKLIDGTNIAGIDITTDGPLRQIDVILRWKNCEYKEKHTQKTEQKALSLTGKNQLERLAEVRVQVRWTKDRHEGNILISFESYPIFQTN